jgi:hypothetical protein
VAALAAILDQRRSRSARSEPTTTVWREQALAEIASSELAVKWLTSEARNGQRLDPDVAEPIQASLEIARKAALDEGLSLRKRISSSFRGASVERTYGQIDAAGEALIRVASKDFVIGQIPRITRRVERALRPDDVRRRALETVAEDYTDASAHADMPECHREILSAALHAANCETRRTQSRIRSFRNMLLLCGLVLTIAAVGLAVLGYTRSNLALLCFQPSGQAVCPTKVVATDDATPVTGQPTPGQSPDAIAAQDSNTRSAASPVDMLLVEVVGLIAATLAAATALRRIHGTSSPYGVPFAVAVLKLPSGALTAALGLLLMRAEFVPGLSALDSPAQIIGWAIVFGYAQQLFTRLVDQRAQTVLNTANGATSTTVDGSRTPAPAAAQA